VTLNPNIRNPRWPLTLVGLGFGAVLALLTSNKSRGPLAWAVALAPLVVGLIWAVTIFLSRRSTEPGEQAPSRTSATELAVNAFVTLLAALIGSGVLLWVLNRPVQAAEQVRSCEHRHGLEQGHGDVRKLQLTASDRAIGAFSRMSISSCEWPPPTYADRDGFARIIVVSAPGPGLDEASSADDVDRYTSACQKIELAYSTGTQGTFAHLPPYVAARGSVIDAWHGNPWPGNNGAGLQAGDIQPYPGRDEIVVVHNDKVAPDYDSIHCVS
jgi:hypothetical protein